MGDHHPRYVLSSDGLWIYDRWNCHREVYKAPHFEAPMGGWNIPPNSREIARALCDKWNAEHDAWLATG